MDGHAAVDDAAVVQALFDEAIALHRLARDVVQPVVIEAAEAIRSAFAIGGKLLVFGNGGSAADAQHLAAELVGRFEREREGLAAIALTTDTSIVTSVANDFTFDWVFARQIEALGRRDDVALGISTSGRSANVLTAIEAANARGHEDHRVDRSRWRHDWQGRGHSHQCPARLDRTRAGSAPDGDPCDLCVGGANEIDEC